MRRASVIKKMASKTKKGSPKKPRSAPVILVSSSVYGMEEMLDQIFAVLSQFGWKVWMSRKGTIPVNPSKTAFQNCLDAVDRCDAFLGIISGKYGSGQSSGEKAITHKEIERAISQNKKRWFMVKADVITARELLKSIEKSYPKYKQRVNFKNNKVLDDIRILDMYAAAIRTDRVLSARTGNWVQEFRSSADVLKYIEAQLSDLQLVFPKRKI